MVEAACVAAAFAASYLGFAALALRQKPHHAAVSGRAGRAGVPREIESRCLALGVAGLGSSYPLSWLAQGPSFGSILWVLLLGAAALSVMFTLTYRPRWLTPLQRLTAAAPGR